jgi:integrase
METLEVSQKTKDKYQQAIRHDIIPGLGQVRIHEVTVGRLDAFLQSKRDTPTVAFVCRVVLSGMFGLAARHDAVPVNPVRETKPITQKRTVKAMSVGEAERLREHIRVWSQSSPSRAYFADMTDLFIATGLRPGEMLGLLWTDLDFKARTLTVTGTLKRDSVNGLHRQDFPKSEAGERVLVLPDFVWPMLSRRKLASTTVMVFPNRFGSWLEAANVTQLWRQACGEEFKDVQMKDFRTAVATLIARELGSEAAAGQLGHSSDAVTKKYYVEKERKAQDNTSVLDRKAQ